MENEREMPRYQSHKIVWALQIKSIEYSDADGDGNRSAVITPVEEGYAPFEVGAEYVKKHNPQVRGFFVVYEEGYQSWSPEDAFLKGNVRIDGMEPEIFDFGRALMILKEGGMVYREGWNGKDLFVFMQVPAEISEEIVPKMQSLPDKVKNEFVMRFNDDGYQVDAIYYSDQLALVNSSNMITGWSPSTSDALADDWKRYRP